MSTGGSPLATAFIEVRGDTTRLPDDIRNGLRGTEQQGRRAGGDLGSGLREGAREGTRRMGDDVRDAAQGGAEDGGKKGGGKFALRFRQSVGSNMSGFGAAFTGLLPVAGVAAVGAAMGAALVSAFTNAIDLDTATTRLAAQLDITRDEAGKYGKLAGDLYAQNYGDSIGGIEESISTVMRNMRGLFTEDELGTVTKQAENLASAFDVDVNEATRGAAQLIRGGLAKDASEAFDIITSGFQQIPNAGEDLLDTFNEYAVQFQKLGLNGDQALGLISQAMDNGARNTDLAADALKEFSIRAVDGSTTSAAGYQAIGLNAQKMTEKIAKGGKDANEGLQQVLDGLRGIEDPAKRGQAAVSLFGTQAEDLGAALYSMDLSGAADQIGRVAGAAERMDETLGDTAQARISSFKRSIEVGFTEAAGTALGALNDITDGAEAAFALFRSGDYTADIGKALGVDEDSKVVGVILDIRDAAKGVVDTVRGLSADGGAGFFDAIGVSPAQVDTILGALSTLKETVTDTLSGIFADIRDYYTSNELGAYFQLAQDIIGGVVEWIKANVVPFLMEYLPQAISYVGDVFTLLGLVIGAALDVIRGVVGVFVGVVTFIWQNFGDTILFLVTAAWNLISGVIGGALDVIQGIVRVFIALFKGDWQGLGDALAQIGRGAMDIVSSIFQGALDALQGAFRLAVDGIKVIWGGVQDAVKTPIRFVIETVLNSGLIDGFNWIADKVGADGLKIPHIPLPKGFSGGGYTGDGGKYEPMGVVHGGEWVIPKEATAKLRSSAPGFLEYLNGFMPGYTNGGIVALGKWFQEKRARVTENSAFGGTTPGAHVGKGHAGDYAIDVNYGPGGENDTEKAFFDSVADQVRKWGYKVLWRVAGHFNHLHAETQNAQGGGMVGEDGGFLSGLLGGLSDPVKFLQDKLTDSFTGMGNAGALGDILRAVPGTLVGALVDKAKSAASSVIGFFTGENDSANGDIKQQVQAVAKARGWDSGAQWAALSALIQKESSWNPNAANPNSSARGLFQKMTSIHGPLESTVAGQAQWGLGYIASRYVDPIRAWNWHKAHNWYAGGTPSAVGGLSWVGENGPELVDFRGGERVYNTALSRKMEASAVRDGGTGPLVGSVTLQSSGNVRDDLGTLHHSLKLIDRGGAYRRRRGA